MTAASHVASAFVSSGTLKTPLSTLKTSLPHASGREMAAAPATSDGMPGTTVVSKRQASRLCTYMYEP